MRPSAVPFLRHWHIARGPMRWFLNACDAAAITLPWGQGHVFVLAEYQADDRVITHEQVHLAQIKRDGAVRFALRYLYWLARYGYRRNPYEVEAYDKAPID